jgi:AraC-like DNA-binding protein
MFVSVIFVRAIVSELQSRGMSPAHALAGIGVRDDQLNDLRARFSYADMDRIIEKAIELTGDPGLGLSIGMNAPESMLQVLGHLIVSCRTLRDAWGLFVRYVPLVAEGMSWNLVEDNEHARFVYHCPVAYGLSTRFAAEYALTMAVRIARHFLPPTVEHADAVMFEHAEPEYVARYTRVFGCPVRYQQPSNALLFPRAYLDVPQLHADPAMHNALREMAERFLHELEGPRSTADRVRVLLGYEADLANIDVVKLSRSVGLTPRSLRRRLASEGVSLTTLIDEARCRLACEELRREGSIKAIAERVGFSEPSAFHRAFKRWTGQTPLEFARRG